MAVQSPISLDALLVLEAISRKGSFSQAADDLHRVRSAITYTVRQLEESLGVKLFDRSGYRTVLTPAGKILVEEGRHLLQEANLLTNKVRQIDSGWEPELKIAYDDSIETNKILDLIQNFYETCPQNLPERAQMKIKISAEILNGCWDALISGRANLAIGATGEASLVRKFGVQSLGKVKFAFVVSPNHPLAKQPEPLQNQDILPYRGIAVADTSRSLTPRGSGILAEQNLLVVPNLQAKLEAHRAGLGVGFMPLHRIKEDVANGRLLIKKVVKAKPDASLTTAWDIAQSGKATQWFLKKLSMAKNCKELIS